MKFISYLLVAGMLFACNTTKKEVTDGATVGVITYSGVENDCEYTISVTHEGATLFYDPINLESDFKKDGLKVRFQYRPLKMKNRCNKANPISITNINKQ